MHYHSQLIDLFIKHFDNYCREHLLKKKLPNPCFVDETAKKVNEFISNTLLDVMKEVFDERWNDIVLEVRKEMAVIFNDILSDNEAKTLCEFMSNEASKKVLRNLDLVGDACSSGFNIMAEHLVKKIEEKSVASLISDFVSEVYKRKEENDE